MATNSNPGWTQGYRPTPAQWNGSFGGKVDGSGGEADDILINSGTIVGTFEVGIGGARIAGPLNIDTLMVAGTVFGIDVIASAFLNGGMVGAGGTISSPTLATAGVIGGTVGAQAQALALQGATVSAAGTLVTHPYGTIALTGTVGTITPGPLDAALVTLPAGTITVNINAGYPNQRFRADFRQPGTGTCVVNFGTSVTFGTDITTFSASTLSGTVDMALFITPNGTIWRFAAADHGYSG